MPDSWTGLPTRISGDEIHAVLQPGHQFAPFREERHVDLARIGRRGSWPESARLTSRAALPRRGRWHAGDEQRPLLLAETSHRNCEPPACTALRPSSWEWQSPRWRRRAGSAISRDELGTERSVGGENVEVDGHVAVRRQRELRERQRTVEDRLARPIERLVQRQLRDVADRLDPPAASPPLPGCRDTRPPP